jgi:hypothetical protein
MDRQDQSDLLAFQFAMGSACLAFVLAGVGAWFVNYGLAISCFVGAALLYACIHTADRLTKVRLEWPIVFSEYSLRDTGMYSGFPRSYQ